MCGRVCSADILKLRELKFAMKGVKKMFSCTSRETRMAIEGKMAGAVRKYGKKCPHKSGGMMTLTSKYLRGVGGKETPFATVVITSVRPGTVGQFRNDKQLPLTDGFANGVTWHTHLSMIYRGIKDDEPVHHITFRIKEVEEQYK